MIKATSVIAILLLWYVGNAQFPNVLIEKFNGTGYAPCEPSIAIDPNNPARMIAGAILDKVYISGDSGRTWQVDKLNSKFGVFGDPCIIAGNDGRFYYFHLSDPSGDGWASEKLLDRIVCQRSKKWKPETGLSSRLKWTKGSSIGLNSPKDQDKEWAVYDKTSDRIYCTWTQFDKYGSLESSDKSQILFSSANKKARRWCKPIVINEIDGDCIDDDLTVEGAVPTVDGEGNIYVAWALGDTLYFDRSLDRGKTWLDEDLRIANISGGWALSIPGINRCNGMPITLCDNSNGPYAGSVYINWSDQIHGTENTDVWLSHSRDKGDTWSQPVMLNQDTGSAHQFFTWCTIDESSGYLYAVYYDRRNHPTTSLKTDVYLAYSRDGGQSWKDTLISEKAFTPSAGKFFGDYNNIAACKGVIRPIWTSLDEGIHRIYTCLINDKDLP